MKWAATSVASKAIYCPNARCQLQALFSHAKMVEDLLRGFVPQSWVQALDFSTLEKVNASYVTDDLRDRHDDVVWRVRFQDHWLYVYLLLEFQSTVDRFMAVRILSYTGLLYQDLIRSHRSTRITYRRYYPSCSTMAMRAGKRRSTCRN